MSQPIHYITNEQGTRVGVLSNLEIYQQLASSSALDQDCLIDLSIEELQALSDSTLTTNEQAKLDDLLAKNKQNKLSEQEQEKLDVFLNKIDSLNLLKTRAKYTLTQLKKLS